MSTESFLRFNKLRKSRAQGQQIPQIGNDKSLLARPGNSRPVFAGTTRRDMAPIATQLQNARTGAVQGGFRPSVSDPRHALGGLRNRSQEQRQFSTAPASALEMLRARLDKFKGGI